VKITLELLGGIADKVKEELRERVAAVFHCPVETKLGSVDLTQAYNSERKQYLSSKLLTCLEKPKENERVVGIVDVDLYVPTLNFVFGEADISSGTAIVSLCRLRQEYYGLPADENLFLDRATKEIVHELGHTLGLKHCSNSKCVMHFSNTLADTDVKEAHFCPRCRPKLVF